MSWTLPCGTWFPDVIHLTSMNTIYKITDEGREILEEMLWLADIDWEELDHNPIQGWMRVRIAVTVGTQTAWMDRGDDYEYRLLFLDDRIELTERGRSTLGDYHG